MKKEDLAKSITETTPRHIFESVFINNYLPLLLHQDPSVFNIAWVDGVAGSPHSEVYLTDASGDNVVAIVPPLRAPTQQITSSSLSNSLELIAQKIKLGGPEAKHAMSVDMTKLVVFDSGLTPEIENKWYELMTRYKMEHLFKHNSGVIEQPVSNVVRGVEDDEGWD